MEKFTFFRSGPFSQWYPSPFQAFDGINYSCAEQFMMAEKARTFEDIDALNKIMATKSPMIQKKIGRTVKNFDASIWDSVSQNAVYEGNFYKFLQNPLLLSELLKTHGTTLVEASPKDKIWGIGLVESDPRAFDRSKWLGQNRLGKILTDLRDDIIKNLNWISKNFKFKVTKTLGQNIIEALWDAVDCERGKGVSTSGYKI